MNPLTDPEYQKTLRERLMRLMRWRKDRADEINPQGLLLLDRAIMATAIDIEEAAVALQE